ncbi:MAG: NifU N-terminal domain-containing protein [Proteobacteria bacterium]|nr:NifU N-terminal domain-containing protein [Pseudomonadota bacterium]
MFIRSEQTPNPTTLKFIPDDKIILEKGTEEFKNQKQAATKSPLALQLFEIAGIESIFFGHDFITITKSETAEWPKIKTEVQATIMDFFMNGKPVMFEQKDSATNSEEDSELVKQIKELIEIKVRPAVAMDGGDIIFHSFEEGVVRLILKGSCSGCPSSSITLKNGIENMLKHYIPEVESVEQVENE